MDLYEIYWKVVVEFLSFNTLKPILHIRNAFPILIPTTTILLALENLKPQLIQMMTVMILIASLAL